MSLPGLHQAHPGEGSGQLQADRLHAGRIDGDKHPELKISKVQWSVKWLVPSFVAMPFLMIWYYAMVPASQRALLTLGIDTINSGTFSTVSSAVIASTSEPANSSVIA